MLVIGEAATKRAGTAGVGKDKVEFFQYRKQGTMQLPVLALLCAAAALGGARAAASVSDLLQVNEVLLKQAIMQQLETEERLRSSFSSGLSSVPQTRGGTEPFHTESGHYFLPVRNYANKQNQVGLGPFSALLNGVAFQSMQSSYSLSMPSTTSKALHAVQDIPLPDVPREVTSKRTVPEQVAEMKEWFKAFATQNERLRRYKPYFKAVLCYLEGAWVRLDKNEYDADLIRRNQQSMFSAYAGYTDSEEINAFVPTTILEIGNDNVPVMAKWDSRILCHPLKKDLPINKFHPIDNFVARVDNSWSMDQLKGSNAARFIVNPSLKNQAFKDQHYKYSFLESLMNEIPGKDNYGATIPDVTFNYESNDIVTGKPLNAANYGQFYKVNKKGAMGLQERHKGWNDQHIFMAKTTQPKVGSLKAQHECSAKTGLCKYHEESRWTWAFPIEILYLTPLGKWNPHGVAVNPNNFYMTPQEFFSGPEVNPDPADTVREYVQVKDQKGKTVKVRASGIRNILPDIEGVGEIRQRFSIVPVDVDGTAEWKELQALKDITLDYPRYKNRIGLKEDVLQGKYLDDKAVDEPPVHCQMSQVSADLSKGIISHNHELLIDYSAIADLKSGKTKSYDVSSEHASGHTHELTVVYKDGVLSYSKCDNRDPKDLCHDFHPRRIFVID